MKRVLSSPASFKEVKLKYPKKKSLSKQLLLTGACASLAVPARAAENKIEVDTSPWDIALGGWKNPGVWDWSWPDKFLADTRDRNISVTGGCLAQGSLGQAGRKERIIL